MPASVYRSNQEGTMRRFMAGLLMAAIVGLLATGALADDQTIARTIVEKLQAEQQQGNLKGFNIGVRVENGDVWMEGDVANPAQRTLVLDIASRVHGVKQVVDGVTIAQPGQPAAPARTATEPSRAKNLFAGLGSAFGSAFAQATRENTPPPPTPVTEPERPKLTPPPSIARPEPSAPVCRPSLASTEPPLSNRLLGTPGEGVPALPQASRPTPPPAIERQVALPTPPLARQVALPTPPPTRQPQVETGVVTASTPLMAELANRASSRPAAAPRMASQMPVAYAPARGASMNQPMMNAPPVPAHVPGTGGGVAPARYDHPHMPGYSWPSYASYPNYAGLTYPKQYSPTAWPYIGPFYPYPQVPLGWRKVMLEWDDGWWMLDFKAK
jgi:hypothetical protein